MKSLLKALVLGLVVMFACFQFQGVALADEHDDDQVRWDLMETKHGDYEEALVDFDSLLDEFDIVEEDYFDIFNALNASGSPFWGDPSCNSCGGSASLAALARSYAASALATALNHLLSAISKHDLGVSDDAAGDFDCGEGDHGLAGGHYIDGRAAFADAVQFLSFATGKVNEAMDEYATATEYLQEIVDCEDCNP